MEQSPKSPKGSGTVVMEEPTRPGKPEPASEVADTVLQPSTGTSEPRAVDVGPVSFETGGRYAQKRVIGLGGMGEVRLCTDAWVGRDVALKVLRGGRGSRSDSRARFLREARVQGQLEHPSVVPVYDLGVAEDGEVFFTMKRIVGLTLENVIAGLNENDREIREAFSMRKLLSSMVQVCLAVAFAHRRGVVHRDLKPANIMLGDFGEVYVLDWGVAKIAGSADLELGDAVSGERAPVVETQAGAVIGTPGYMAPEQVRGDATAISPQTDVYALGAILFEILALTQLHRGATLAEVFSKTLSTDGASARARAPDLDVPPELDAICSRATRLAPGERHGSARDLADAIERYLEGARDEERRRELAGKHLSDARAALAAARAGGAQAEQEQRAAVRDLGRALALDPENRDALRVLLDFLAEPSDRLPPDAERALKEVERSDRAKSSRRAALTYGSVFLVMPLMEWAGVLSWSFALTVDGLLLTLIGYLLWIARPERATPGYMRWSYVLNFVVVAMFYGLFGPLVLVPGVVGVACTATIVSVRANRTTRRALVGMSLAAVAVPLCLQLVGFLPPSYAFENGVIEILPNMIRFPKTASLAFWIVVTMMQIVAGGLLAGGAVDALVAAERRNFGQAWRLKQLLPADAAATEHFEHQ
jgi:eukaryotic-like serine/threonine-protein kinase